MRIDMIRDLKDCNQFRQTIQSKPPRIVHCVGLVVLALMAIATVWAAQTRANLVVRAAGRIRPVTTPNKVFVTRTESLGGKVAEVHFRQGQDVKAGDLLLRLDTERLCNEIARKRRAIRAAEDELDQGNHLEELQMTQAEAVMAKMEAQLAEAQEEVNNGKDRLAAERQLAEGELADAIREEATLRHLAASQAAAQIDVIKATAQRREAQKKLQRLNVPLEEGKIAVLKKALTLAKQDESIRRQERKMKCAMKRAEIEAAKIEIANLDLDVQQAEVRAPLTGVVTSAEMKVGDIVEPGRPVVEIAERRGFFFETYVTSEAIADISLGMPVKIKVEAFDFQKYGTIGGTIAFIAPDSTPLEGRPDAVYLVRVNVDGESLGRGDLTGQIKLGMDGQAEIVTGEETVLKLVFKKVRQSVSLR
jgi:multidrug efflux pump subunit AcrA (membrane-fusion protein)